MKKSIIALLVFGIIGFSACSDKDDSTYAMIVTNHGDMKVELYNSTPIHKANFVKIAEQGFYNDLLFHRVIKGFMIQGGDPNSKGAPEGVQLGSGGPGYTIEAEIGAPHFKGTLAAARTGGASNPEKRSSGSQFYIVEGRPVTNEQLDNFERSKGIKYNAAQRAKYLEVGGTPMLDGDYTVYGEVVEGMDVIDKIAALKTERDRPLEDATMKVRILK